MSIAQTLFTTPGEQAANSLAICFCASDLTAPPSIGSVDFVNQKRTPGLLIGIESIDMAGAKPPGFTLPMRDPVIVA